MDEDAYKHKALTHVNGAGNRVRTGDLNLGKVALYQLSYSRIDIESQFSEMASRRGVEPLFPP